MKKYYLVISIIVLLIVILGITFFFANIQNRNSQDSGIDIPSEIVSLNEPDLGNSEIENSEVNLIKPDPDNVEIANIELGDDYSDITVVWSVLRKAILANDMATIESFVRFPLKTQGPLDSDPIIEFDDTQFNDVLRIYLGQPHPYDLTKTELELIQGLEVLDSKKRTKTENWIRISNMEFELVGNYWYLTFLYLYEDSYEKLGIILER